MTILDAIILGIVEGLTEFIPVSSTGHLIITQALLGLEGDAIDAYLIVIQLGAILAVALHYRKRLVGMVRGICGGDANGRALAFKLMVAFMPAAVVGLLFEDVIGRYLFESIWVAVALVVGGVLMILVDRPKVLKPGPKTRLEDVTYTDAIWIGVAQCASLWPGTSRSMATMVGGRFRGLCNTTAADFAFLLGLPTLGAAACYKMLTNWDALLAMPGGLPAIVTGLVVSFFVGWGAVAWFLRILGRVGLAPFGAYRIAVGGIVAIMIWRGMLA